MVSKTIKVSEETHAKISSVKESYQLSTLGDAITYAINQLFLEDTTQPQQTPTERDPRDVEEIEFLRKLALAQAKSNINVNVGGGVSYIPTQPLTPKEEEKETLEHYMEFSENDYDKRESLSDAEIALLKGHGKKEFEESHQELQDIYDVANGKILAPSDVMKASSVEFKEDGIESFEEAQARIQAHREGLKNGTVKPKGTSEQELLDLRAKNSLRETAGVPGLTPPPT